MRSVAKFCKKGNTVCNFLSALVFKNGSIFCAPEATDSHTDLIDAKGLTDSDKSLHLRGWIRVEFSPPSPDKLAEPDSYVLKVDETSTPEWFDDALRFQVTEDLRERIERMTVRDERAILLGGCWILASEAKVGRAAAAKIVAMLGSSSVKEMRDSSSVKKMLDSSTAPRKQLTEATP